MLEDLRPLNTTRFNAFEEVSGSWPGAPPSASRKQEWHCCVCVVAEPDSESPHTIRNKEMYSQNRDTTEKGKQ